MRKVAVLGGGVAGLSAAHELAERGFEVHVYQLREAWGGKARSMGKPKTGQNGNKDLPGEHGFRFFPGFYRHVPDTMRRIPTETGTVFDNLVACHEFQFLQTKRKPVRLPITLPRRIRQWIELISYYRDMDAGLERGEKRFFVGRLLRFLMSCEARRYQQWEQVPWWDFIDGKNRSVQYQKLLAAGMTRSLVAMKAEVASTRTVATILLQLIFDILSPSRDADRVLNAPTNEAWIEPWLKHLGKCGNVTLHDHCRLVEFELKNKKISRAFLLKEDTDADGDGQPDPFEVEADYYLAAVPVEVLVRIAQGPLATQSPQISRLSSLEVEWMNGIQFYLTKRLGLVAGHVTYVDSPWALTSISQPQFWGADVMTKYGDGRAAEILSIDISDWGQDGIGHCKPARQCTEEEVVEEVWSQVLAHFRTALDELPTLDDRLDYFIDPAIVFPKKDPPAGEAAPYAQMRGMHSVGEIVESFSRRAATSPFLADQFIENTNQEPLLINTINSWNLRPDATLDIENLFLASDYVQTHTDLACMEGANEAARRAVNGILDACGSDQNRCKIWPLHEPRIFLPFRAIDRILFALFRPKEARPAPAP